MNFSQFISILLMERQKVSYICSEIATVNEKIIPKKASPPGKPGLKISFDLQFNLSVPEVNYLLINDNKEMFFC